MLPLLLSLVATTTAQSVTLPGGTLQGGTCESSNASYYYSIPFAQAPVGDLRFAPPVPYSGSLDIDATAESPKCAQWASFIENGNVSEDCLYLNVWVPPNATGLPVKFWIYGGGNNAGSISNPTYNGCNLATDSIVVSVNYRLGPLGFLGLQDWGVQGNMGLQDILLGLQWVQDNIGNFGGDPSKVLLFGQSAGASDTYTIGSLPQASSLISAGAAESGGGRIYPEADAANAFGAAWAESVGCSDIACLRSRSLSELNVTLPDIVPPGSAEYNPYAVDSFNIFVDGTVVPAQPNDVGAQVPFIFGATTQEGTLGLLTATGDPSAITPEVYREYLATNFGLAAALVESRYPVAAFNSTPFPAFYAYVEVATVTSYICPAYQGLVSAARAGTPAWTYRWAHVPTCPWYEGISAESLPILGATHTAEIPFVFANIRNPPVYPECSYTDSEVALSDQFVKFWSSLASNGNPGNQWPVFSTEESLGVNVANGSRTAASGVVDYSACAFWERVQQVVAGSAANGTSMGNGTSTGGPTVPVQQIGSANAKEITYGLLVGMLVLVGVSHDIY